MKQLATFIILFLATISYAQDNQINTQQTTPQQPKEKSEFWKKVRFGGGLNIGFGNSTVIGISPEAIYQASDKFAIGTGVGYQYVKYRNTDFSQHLFSVSALALYTPFYGLQLSAKPEQNFVTGSNVNNRSVTALYLGAGYSPSPNVTMGIQYDILYNENKSIYSSPFAPFVRVFF